MASLKPARKPSWTVTRLALTLGFATLATACQSTRSAHRPQPGEIPDQALLLHRLSEAAQKRQSLRATALLTYYGDKGRVRARAVILAKRPGWFRIEVLSPFGEAITVMTANGRRIAWLAEGRLFVGPANRYSLRRMLPMAISPEELVDALLGGIPSGEGLKAEALSWSGAAWELRLKPTEGEGQIVLTLNEEQNRVREIQLRDAEQVQRLRIVLDDFRKVGEGGEAGELPYRMLAKTQDAEEDFRVRLKEAEVNVDLEDSLFTIEPPSGLKAESL